VVTVSIRDDVALVPPGPVGVHERAARRAHLYPAPVPTRSAAPALDAAAVVRTARSYRGASAWMRAYVAARICVAPLAVIGQELAEVRGRVLSLGCGAAVIERYVAELNPEVEVHGFDLDDRNIEVIERTRTRCPRVSVERHDITQLDQPPINSAVLLSDVLHHLPPASHLALARAVEHALAPGGICVIKDLDAGPRWKNRWNRVHDRIVAGPEPIHCRPLDEMTALFGRVGLDVKRSERIDGPWTPYAHYLITLRKPG
jgi:SAM-dependent methyltransferase